MLYLAEVKKQNRSFMGGSKTEFKLLACQHTDQTWSSISAEEVVAYEESLTFGEGTLVLINLNANRQFQHPPELAGGELVRQLQRISRLMEKGKDEQDKIEQWKQSLQYQSEELSRRQMELEAREEQIEQMEGEFEYLERQRQELYVGWEQLRQEQAQLQSQVGKLGPALNLSPDQNQFVQALIDRLSQNSQGLDSLWQPLQTNQEAINRQQGSLDTHWKQLEQYRHALGEKYQHLNDLQGHLNQQKQEFKVVKASLEQAKSQCQIQETILTTKQELLGRTYLNWQNTEQLWDKLNRLALGLDDPQLEGKLDIEALEKTPIHELEENLHKLQGELDKLGAFVNEQEEELSWQSQAVEELQTKIAQAREEERPSLEEQISEEQERKGMLEETLVGQRRNLRDRQEILDLYSRILKRRQGIFTEGGDSPFNLTPILVQLGENLREQSQEKESLEEEISHIQESLRQVRAILDSQWHEQENKSRTIEEMEAQTKQLNLEINQLQAQIAIYEAVLQPIQEHLNSIRQQHQAITSWLNYPR